MGAFFVSCVQAGVFDTHVARPARYLDDNRLTLLEAGVFDKNTALRILYVERIL